MSGLWRGPHVLHLPGGRYWQQSEACRDPAENGFCNQVPSSELFKPESEESLLGRAENWVRSLPPGPEAPSGPRPSPAVAFHAVTEGLTTQNETGVCCRRNAVEWRLRGQVC